ncbi:hypothetical protein SFR_3609 [Streptomyces sp. FR-008]|nr:hypothetical protein SFR_3609 [Streptomyces sp. FR-008]
MKDRRFSRTRGHGVGRLRPQILLGAIRLDLAVHEEPADGGQCDQEKLLHRATSSFVDVGDL